MKHLIIAALFLGIFSCSGHKSPLSGKIDSALDRLDRTLEDTEMYEYFKIERINNLQHRVQNSSDRESMYWLMDDIYHEYNRYDLDSTARYASLKMSLAKKRGQ